MKCHVCFQGEILPVARAGRTTRYKALPSLAVPADLPIPTCNACGEEWISPDDAKRIDAALEMAYRAELARRVRAVLPSPAEADRVERNLGLSRGYLSRLRNGTKAPSEVLLALLALIREEPETLALVERNWQRTWKDDELDAVL